MCKQTRTHEYIHIYTHIHIYIHKKYEECVAALQWQFTDNPDDKNFCQWSMAIEKVSDFII